jgi:hypothetical protein
MSMNPQLLFVVATVTLAAAVPGQLISQPRTWGPRPSWADSTPARIMSRGKEFPIAEVQEVLRQRHQGYPAAKRRELAELVVKRAIADPTVGRPAIEALAMSGSSDKGLGGTPDVGALDRLIQIHRSATSADERHFALIELINQVNPTRALPYLREVATSNNEDDAYWAVVQIGRLAFGLNTSRATPPERAQAEKLLRDLYDQNLVRGSGAGLLCETAAIHKWPSTTRCRGGG